MPKIEFRSLPLILNKLETLIKELKLLMSKSIKFLLKFMNIANNWISKLFPNIKFKTLMKRTNMFDFKID